MSLSQRSGAQWRDATCATSPVVNILNIPVNCWWRYNTEEATGNDSDSATKQQRSPTLCRVSRHSSNPIPTRRGWVSLVWLACRVLTNTTPLGWPLRDGPQSVSDLTDMLLEKRSKSPINTPESCGTLQRVDQHHVNPYGWRMGCHSSSGVCEYLWQHSVTEHKC